MRKKPRACQGDSIVHGMRNRYDCSSGAAEVVAGVRSVDVLGPDKNTRPRLDEEAIHVLIVRIESLASAIRLLPAPARCRFAVGRVIEGIVERSRRRIEESASRVDLEAERYSSVGGDEAKLASVGADLLRRRSRRTGASGRGNPVGAQVAGWRSRLGRRRRLGR